MNQHGKSLKKERNRIKRNRKRKYQKLEELRLAVQKRRLEQPKKYTKIAYAHGTDQATKGVTKHPERFQHQKTANI